MSVGRSPAQLHSRCLRGRCASSGPGRSASAGGKSAGLPAGQAAYTAAQSHLRLCGCWCCQCCQCCHVLSGFLLTLLACTPHTAQAACPTSHTRLQVANAGAALSSRVSCVGKHTSAEPRLLLLKREPGCRWRQTPCHTVWWTCAAPKLRSRRPCRRTCRLQSTFQARPRRLRRRSTTGRPAKVSARRKTRRAQLGRWGSRALCGVAVAVATYVVSTSPVERHTQALLPRSQLLQPTGAHAELEFLT